VRHGRLTVEVGARGERGGPEPRSHCSAPGAPGGRGSFTKRLPGKKNRGNSEHISPPRRGRHPASPSPVASPTVALQHGRPSLQLPRRSGAAQGWALGPASVPGLMAVGGKPLRVGARAKSLGLQLDCGSGDLSDARRRGAVPRGDVQTRPAATTAPGGRGLRGQGGWFGGGLDRLQQRRRGAAQPLPSAWEMAKTCRLDAAYFGSGESLAQGMESRGSGRISPPFDGEDALKRPLLI